MFYIKRWNSFLFNSIGILYRVGSIAKLLNIKPGKEQEKNDKTRKHNELNKQKKNIATVRKVQYKLSTGTKHVNIGKLVTVYHKSMQYLL